MNQDTTTKSIKQPGQKPRRRRGGWFLNIILLVGLGVLVFLFYQAEQKRQASETQLQQTSQQLEELRQASENRGQEVANQVLSKVRAHIDLPAEPAPTVATITDIDSLRSTNEFYQKAENGDHLILTEKRAVLYDPDRDIILDVVPVRINQTTPSPAAPGASVSPAPATSPTPTTSGSPVPSVQPTTSPNAN